MAQQKGEGFTNSYICMKLSDRLTKTIYNKITYPPMMAWVGKKE